MHRRAEFARRYAGKLLIRPIGVLNSTRWTRKLSNEKRIKARFEKEYGRLHLKRGTLERRGEKERGKGEEEEERRRRGRGGAEGGPGGT